MTATFIIISLNLAVICRILAVVTVSQKPESLTSSLAIGYRVPQLLCCRDQVGSHSVKYKYSVASLSGSREPFKRDTANPDTWATEGTCRVFSQ